ncbi:nitrous oxide reductase accessory protein NosL [Christiangramia crocea]|uniref:Nitrous oxide reductase accessory protein NosL n=1 Tax=Christiangramia crocea TaxID=2904124 RepID=A0A9X1UX59_9FLAO|nr:nitrous oxide reductase accessory protein NosL [Gramella crocea]MCG9971919.1 nitrous oxide reductase accessory protein NosL [Gramella crocea]
MKRFIYTLIFAFTLISCEIGPEPINYGEDGCEYCKMTIVDKQHASELVTSKGKIYKFDAIECMINFRKEHKDIQYAMYLVSDFSKPGELIDATMATFLISEKISSPMGANLSAFYTETAANEIQASYGGDIYNWHEIQPYIGKN